MLNTYTIDGVLSAHDHERHVDGWYRAERNDIYTIGDFLIEHILVVIHIKGQDVRVRSYQQQVLYTYAVWVCYNTIWCGDYGLTLTLLCLVSCCADLESLLLFR